MTKEFEYKGYKFITSVELRHRVERRIGGTVLHLVTTNCLGGSNFYTSKLCYSTSLSSVIEDQEKAAREFVDKFKNPEEFYSEDEKLLTSIGFK